MITVVVNTLNEDKYLERLLKSLSNFADEIVVVDMQSTDTSVLVAKRYGALVYEHEKMDYVELARNFGISKAKGEWVLVMDPDEELSADLKRTLKEKIRENKYDYFRIPRKNIVFGKWLKHSRWWPDYNIRFFKKGAVEWDETIHSVPITHGTGSDLEASEDNSLIHHHYESISQFINRMDRYTKAQAQTLVKNNHKFHWFDLIIQPANEFLSRFFVGEAYKDGVHGLALSTLQAFSELVVYLKVWELNKFEKQNLPLPTIISKMRGIEKDFHYWEADSLLKNGGGLINRFKRRLKLP